jgi:hypothetical protein
MKRPKFHKSTIPLVLVSLLISISFSYYIATAIDVDLDEIGALFNLFIPLIIGGVTFLAMILMLFFSKKERAIFYTLFFLIGINLITGVYLKLKFKAFSSGLASKSNHMNRFSSLISPVIDSNNIVIENMDGFSANGLLTFSVVHKSGKPVGDIRKNNFDHQQVTFRLINKNAYKVTFIDGDFSDDGLWHIERISGPNNVQQKFPFVLSPSEQAYITVGFTAAKIEDRVKAPWWKYAFKIQNFLAVQSREFNYQNLKGATCVNVSGILTLKTDDKRKPYPAIYLNGLWQYKVEGDWEPDMQRVVNTLGFKTVIGFKNFDNGLKGAKLIPFSDEIQGTYFRAAESAGAVKITKLAAYHGCCSLESFDTTSYYYQGESKLTPIFFAIPRSGQMLFPNGCLKGANSITFNPTTSFALKIGKSDMERKKNFDNKIGVRIWKARDRNGLIISNAFILGSDHLGAKGTNYDYQDEVFYIENVKLSD